MAAERRAELLVQTVTLKTHPHLVDKKENRVQHPMPNHLHPSSEMLVFPIHMTWAQDPTQGPSTLFWCQRVKGKLEGDKEGAHRLWQQYQHSITHRGQTHAWSKNSAVVPMKWPTGNHARFKVRDVDTVPGKTYFFFVKHKVLFILTFFLKLKYHRKQKRNSIIVSTFPASAGRIQKSELGISIGDFFFPFVFSD